MSVSVGSMQGISCRRRRAAAVLAAVAAVLVAPPALAEGRERAAAAVEPFGVNAGVLWLDGLSNLPADRHTDAMRRAGLGSVRQLAVWNEIEPHPPDARTGAHSYRWASTDRIATALARERLRWTVVLGLTTPWAGAVPGVWAGPPRTQPFADYAAAVAERYGRRGTFWSENPELPYAPVVAYQVWNEPNVPGSATSMRPDEYAQLYAAAREAVLAVDPHARVAVGGLAHSQPDPGDGAVAYLRGMLEARPDLRGSIDAVGVTVYRRQPAEVFDKIAGLRRGLDALGEGETPIDLDETGWATAGGVPFTDITPVSDEQRGRYLRELVEGLAGSDCGVASVTPYAWVTPEDNALDAAAWFGLADRRSAVLRPSGGAYADAVRAATDAGDGGGGGPHCGRDDLPRLLDAHATARPFSASVVRACSRRRMTVRWSHGPGPEPYAEVELTLPGGRPRVYSDPDAGGPRRIRTSVRMRIPRRKGDIRLVARDELGRVAARTTAELRRCPPRRGR